MHLISLLIASSTIALAAPRELWAIDHDTKRTVQLPHLQVRDLALDAVANINLDSQAAQNISADLPQDGVWRNRQPDEFGCNVCNVDTCMPPGFRCCAPPGLRGRVSNLGFCRPEERCTVHYVWPQLGRRMCCRKDPKAELEWICPDSPRWPEVADQIKLQDEGDYRWNYWNTHKVAGEYTEPRVDYSGYPKNPYDPEPWSG